VGSSDGRPEWVEQLAPGGRLLLPLAVRGSQLSVALDRGPDGWLHSDSVRGCAFIRLRGIGSDGEPAFLLPDGLTLQLPEDGPGADPVALAQVLREPGRPLAAGAPLGPEDVWDGFGFWLAMTDPGAVRLVADNPERLAVPLGPASATVAIATPPGASPAGLAAVVPSRVAGSNRVPVAVVPFGPAGPALAARMLAALEAWKAVGAPQSSRWRITVVPGPAPVTLAPGPVVVRKALSHLVLDLS
jgi:protein-L-isoaspartate(D-aspartate) O-methyltransferase